MDNRVEIILAAKDITGKAFTKVQGQLKSLTSAVFSFHGALAGAAAVTGLGYFVKKNLEAADSIAKISDSIGVSTKSLQEYRFVAERSGVATAQLDQGLSAFSKRLGELRSGTGALHTMLSKNNEALRQQLLATNSTDEALDIFLNTLSKIENQSDKTALSAAAFSRTAGIKMTNLVKDGTAGLEEMRNEFSALGLEIDEKWLRQSEKAVDQFTNLEYAIKTRLMGAVVKAAPEITKIVTQMTNWVTANDDLIKQNIPVYIDAMAASAKGLHSVFKVINDEAKVWGLVSSGKMSLHEYLKTNAYDIKKIIESFDNEYANIMSGGVTTKNINSSTPGYEIYNPAKNPSKSGSRGNLYQVKTDLDEIDQKIITIQDAWGAAWDIDYGIDEVQAAIDKIAIIRNNEAIALKTNIDLQNRMDKAIEDTYDIDFGTVTDGMDEIKNIGEETAESWKNAFDGWASNFSATLNDMLWGAETTFNDIARSFGKMITQMMIQKNVMDPMAKLFDKTGGFGLDKLFDGLGGMINSAFQPAAGSFSAPTYSMADGGIINEHVLGIGLNSGKSYQFGESGSEVVIPGKNLARNDTPGSITNIYIQAIDTQTFADAVKRNPGSIVAVIDRALTGNTGLRQTMRRTM